MKRAIAFLLAVIMVIGISSAVTFSSPDGYHASAAGSLSFASNVKYYINLNNNYIYGIEKDTTISAFAAGIITTGIQMFDSTGTLLNTAAPAAVKTGYTVKADNVTYTVIVTGDVDADGTVSANDYLAVKMYFKGTQKLGASAIAAADIDLSGTVSTFDYIAIRRSISNTYNILTKCLEYRAANPTTTATTTAPTTPQETEGPDRKNYALASNGGKYALIAGAQMADSYPTNVYKDSFTASDGVYGTGKINDGSQVTADTGAWVEYARQAQADGTYLVSFVFKLKNMAKVNTVVINAGLSSNDDTRSLPSSVKAYVSDTDTSFSTVLATGTSSQFTLSGESGYSLKLKAADSALIKYVKVECKMDTFVGRIGEIEIWGGKESEVVEDVNAKLEIANKTGLVGICYSTWHSSVVESGNTKIIQNCLNGTSSWDSLNSFHWWGKPALGFYKSNDTSVIRTHMTQLAAAGVDFIIVDNTNAQLAWKNGYGSYSGSYWESMVYNPAKAILDTIVAMRSEGKKTPYVVFWNRTNEGWGVNNDVYNNFYVSKYYNCFVYWNNKPFFLTTTDSSDGLSSNSSITYRKMWGLMGRTLRTSEWSYLEATNKISYDSSGKAEHTSVSVAMQQTYMSNTSTATGRNGGKTWYNQWVRAFANKPKIVTVTWWNEWCAQRFSGNVFTDLYTTEYSRDIEPMTGGHGDKYYQWLIKYVSAYKSGQSCPQLYD